MIYIGLLIIVVNALPSEQPIVNEQPIVQTEQQTEQPGLIYVSCEVCGWKSGYETMPSAKMGLGAHRGWCKRGHGRKLRPFG